MPQDLPYVTERLPAITTAINDAAANFACRAGDASCSIEYVPGTQPLVVGLPFAVE